MWRCNKCGKETERLQIHWGMSGTEKVDVLDYFCPSCLFDELTFQGTEKEENDYWDTEWEAGK